jgi:hypothetical protein
MIIVKLKGGLGNQLFQYAFGKYFSIKNNVEFKIDNGINSNKQDTYRRYLLDNFNIKAELATKEEVLKAKYPLGIISKIWRGFKSKILKIYNIGWSPKILKSKVKYFDGFWQSYKYLDPIKDVLLEEITPKESIENKYSNLISEINNSNSVSIHIRRGDYVNDKKTKSAHLTFGMEYYTEAIKTIKEKVGNPVFYIFSDDIEWVKENFKIDSSTVFVSKPDIKDYEELIIMSKCKYNIIANSSFSFWGAWLNQNPNKIVIAPKKWNNKYTKQYKDLLPPEWIKI